MFEKFFNKKVDEAVERGVEKVKENVKENVDDIMPIALFAVLAGICVLGCFSGSKPTISNTYYINYYIYGGKK